MATPYYDRKIRSGLSRIKEAVSSTAWVHTELSSCLEEMARGLNECLSAFERRIQALEREARGRRRS